MPLIAMALFRLIALATLLTIALSLPVAAQFGPATPQSLHVRLRAEIGGDVVSEEYLLHRVGDIAISPAGDIYLLDSGDKQVKVYNPEGRFLRRFGREGAGPGEFLAPGDLQVDSQVRVFDGRQLRVAVFSLEGAHLDTRRLPVMSDPPPSATYELRADVLLGISPARFSPGRPEHQPNQLVTSRVPGSARVDVLFSYHSGGVLWHPEGQRYPWGGLTGGFGAGGAMALDGDSLLALADGYSGQVTWYIAGTDGLSIVRRARLPLTSPPVTAADLADAEKKFREAHEEPLPRRLVLEGPSRWSIASRALFADDGSLWVRSSVDAAPGDVWSVFLTDSGTPRVVRMPPNFDLRAIHGERMYGIARTDNDAQLVRIFEWRWQ